MSPEQQIRGGKLVATNNIYTALLALAFLVVLATCGFIPFKCYLQYGNIFSIP